MKQTAEEFFRNKLKELHPNREVISLAYEMISAEQGLRWAHEFKQLHLQNVSGSLQDRLFELANDFAVAKQGEVAVKLHSIHNGLQLPLTFCVLLTLPILKTNVKHLNKS